MSVGVIVFRIDRDTPVKDFSVRRLDTLSFLGSLILIDSCHLKFLIVPGIS